MPAHCWNENLCLLSVRTKNASQRVPLQQPSASLQCTVLVEVPVQPGNKVSSNYLKISKLTCSVLFNTFSSPPSHCLRLAELLALAAKKFLDTLDLQRPVSGFRTWASARCFETKWTSKRSQQRSTEVPTGQGTLAEESDVPQDFTCHFIIFYVFQIYLIQIIHYLVNKMISLNLFPGLFRIDNSRGLSSHLELLKLSRRWIQIHMVLWILC